MDYYFDSCNGDNDDNGNSPEAAWADFTNINGNALQPGDRLLLKRGSHFRQQLTVRAVGTADAWIEITAYGDGPRPVIEGRSTGPCALSSHAGELDPSAPCVHITESGYLKVSSLTVYHAFYGLLANNTERDHSYIHVEDIVALDISNFGQADPRVNAAGIEIMVGRGTPTENVCVSDVVLRRCECFRTGTGIATRARGKGCRIERVHAEKITVHDNADTPWSYVGLFVSQAYDSEYDGVCLHGCAPHWKHNGTAMVHHIRSDQTRFRNCCFTDTQDTDSHDMGAWDFEYGGDDCLIDNCTFENNAGPAVEFLLTTETIQNAEIRNCTFIGDDWTRWGGGNVIHDGRTGQAPTGHIHDNNYVLAAGTSFIGCDYFRTHDNHEYAARDDLPPFLEPPRVDAGGDRALTECQTHLEGHVENSTNFHWETIIAPGEVIFSNPESLHTNVSFGKHGTYVLRLFAENEHFIYGDYITIRVLADCSEEVLLSAKEAEPKPTAIALPQRFSLACRFRLAPEAGGARTLLANAGGGWPAAGFKLYVNRRGTQDGSIRLETGNGEDGETAYSQPGVVQSGKWHHLVVAVDCTSQDTRGAARFILDGEDVTLHAGIRADCKRDADLYLARPAPAPPATKEVLDAVEGPPSFNVPDGFALEFYDDFQEDFHANWTALSGEWHTAPDGVCGERGELRCRHKFPGDVILVYEASTVAEAPSDLSAVLNAAPDLGTMHGYFFGFGTDGNTGAKLLRRTGPIATYGGIIESGHRHCVACCRQGNRFAHWAAGTLLYEYDDPRPVAGGRQPFITLYTHAGGCFHRVWCYTRSVSKRTPPQPLRGELHDVRIYRRTLSPTEAKHLHL